jgi:signal transduction histidine kinase
VKLSQIFNLLALISLLALNQHSLLALENVEPDSLKIELSKPYHDTLRFDILIKIGDYFEYSLPDSAIAYYNQASGIADKNINNPSENSEKFLKMKIKALRYIGYVYLNKGEYKTASEMYFNALKLSESIGDSISLYNCYNNIGILNHLQKEYDVASTYYNMALLITDKTGNRFGKSKLLINMGNLYFDLGDATDSIPKRLQNYGTALENYKKALDIKIEVGDIKGQSLCCNNIGNINKKKAPLVKSEKEKRALLSIAKNYYLQSIKLSNSINDKQGLSMVYGNLSDLYSSLNALSSFSLSEKEAHTDSAIHFASKAYEIAVELNTLYLQNEIALLLRNAYSLKGDSKKALKYANIHIETKDQLFSEEKTKALKEMMAKYETEKKDKEIKLLGQQHEIQRIQLENAKQEKIIYITIALALFGLAALITLLYLNRKRANELLNQKNNELKVLNTTKDKFISILAHDLKNPFSAFCNITSVLNDNFEEIELADKKHYVNELNQSAHRLNDMLKNMLEWAIIQLAPPFTSLEAIAVLPIVTSTIENLNSFAKSKQIDIVTNIDSEFSVIANKEALFTIFNNLITNAIKFSNLGSTVTVSAIKSNGRICITVADKGRGISQSDVNKLFRIDENVRTIGKSEGKGTGLGLILCKELLDKMNGNIWVESQLGQGSSFIFELPEPL